MVVQSNYFLVLLFGLVVIWGWKMNSMKTGMVSEKGDFVTGAVLGLGLSV